MTTLNIGVTAYSVQSAKPDTVFGQLAKLPVKSNAAGIMLKASLAKIPKGATVTNAVLRYTVAASVAGTFTLRANRFTTAWPSKLTWANRGTLGPALLAAAVTNPTNGQVIDIPVTATVQSLVAGTATDLGWYTTAQESATLNLRGTSAASGRPLLIVTYTVTPPVPTNLQPSEAQVSVSKPTLLFDADPNITALQVQVDPAANGTTPAYDSGQQAATGGLWDLSASSYAGLAVGATTYWRVQQWTAGGASGWSGWTTFSRVAASALTITSPSGTAPVSVQDGTPPITWTYSGAQVAWRVRLLDTTGKVLADSGRTPGTATSWTPPAGLTASGQHGIIEVTAWPNSNRAATPGDPVESIATLEVVLSPDGTLEAFTAITATSPGLAPTVTVTGHRSAIPDFVALLRNGKEVGRWVGTDVCVPATGGGYTATVKDDAAIMGRSVVYALAPVVNGKKGNGAAAPAMVPYCRGIWITDADGNRVPLWDTDDADQSQPETAVVHQPIGDEAPVVRRRLMRAKPQGTVSGTVFDVGTWLATTSEDLLHAWAEDGDAGDIYTLVLAGWTGSVILGDITFTEVNSSPGNGRVFRVSANYWAQ